MTRGAIGRQRTTCARAGGASRSDELEAFRELRRTGDLTLRNRLVEDHAHLIDPIVRRMARSSALADDLRQVALIGLIEAVERFDPARGVSFRAFAVRTVEGVCKRHLRDRTWMVRPPRRLHDDHLELRNAVEHLTHELRRPPTPVLLARHLGWSEKRVLEALKIDALRRVGSLDQPDDDDREPTVAERGPVHVDPDADDRIRLIAALRCLAPVDREIVVLRYWTEWNQDELGARAGISQSFLSRRLRRAVAELRVQLGEAR